MQLRPLCALENFIWFISCNSEHLLVSVFVHLVPRAPLHQLISLGCRSPLAWSCSHSCKQLLPFPQGRGTPTASSAWRDCWGPKSLCRRQSHGLSADVVKRGTHCPAVEVVQGTCPSAILYTGQQQHCPCATEHCCQYLLCGGSSGT